MNCLKCGRDTTQDQVFCDRCLEIMDAYPVKPGTPVHLPHWESLDAAKRQNHRKRALSQEEHILLLRKHLRRMRICAGILALVLCLATAMLLYEILTPNSQVIGQNYTIDTTQQTD